MDDLIKKSSLIMDAPIYLKKYTKRDRQSSWFQIPKLV